MATMATLKKRLTASLLACVTMASVMAGGVSMNADAAWTWRKGGFAGGTSYCTWQYIKPQTKAVYSSSAPFGYWYYPKSKNAKVYFYSYKGNGKTASGTTMYVQVYHNRDGNCIYNYSMKNGGSVTLTYKTWEGWGDRSSCQLSNEYKIHIRRRYSSTNVEWWAMKVDNSKAYWV